MNNILDEHLDMVLDLEGDLVVQDSRLLHGIMGIATEAGELLDLIKKSSLYDTEIDLVDLKDELGDLMFYVQLVMCVAGLTLDDILGSNILKLRTRYGDKFSKERGLNRDREKERKALEE